MKGEDKMAEMMLDERRQYAQYFNLLQGGVCMIAADGSERIVFASRQMALLFECEDEEEFLKYYPSYQYLIDGRDYKPLREYGNLHPEHFSVDFHYQTKKGHFREVEGTGALRNTAFGKTYVLQFFSSEQISNDRKVDGITELPGMHDFLNEAFRRAKKRKTIHRLRDFCPVCFDVTNFKEYNRQYGVHQGDLCLKKIGDTITEVFPGALVGHLAADRFVALLPEKNLEAKLEQVCNEVNHYIHDDGIQMKVGVYRASENDSLDDLRNAFDLAKMACDSIKEDGNRIVAFYEPSMGESAANKTYVLRHFNEALERHYIKVYLQPVIRTMTGRVSGFEALARWEDPELGMIYPNVFIPVLEEAQLINRLDRYILEHVLYLSRDRMENGLPLLPISMNLSAYDFEVVNPLDTIEKLVSRYHVPRSVLCFEITERIMLRNRHSMVRTIQRFQQAGYQIWMDDFGSEYSSLNSLHNFQFDVIKIDMGFFSHFDDRSRQIITSVVTMAKMLGVQTLAEGVETQEQVSFLKKINCGRIQGYYYGRPMRYEDSVTYIHGRGMQIESPEEAHLLDAAEDINIISDSPTSLFSFDGKNIVLLIENDAYRRELRSAGTQSMEEANAYLSDEGSPVRDRFVQLLQRALKSHAEESMVYADNGQYMKVNVRWIAGDARRWVGVAHIYNISNNASLQFANNLDHTLRNIFQLYEGFYLIDRGSEEVKILRSSHPEIKSQDGFSSIAAFVRYFRDELIYPDDRDRFFAFVQAENAETEGGSTDKGIRAEILRVRTADGTYRWAVFEALVLYKSKAKNLLLCEREDIWERKRDRDALLPEFCQSFGVPGYGTDPTEEVKDGDLFRTLCDASPYEFFWMDRQRKLLGASREFVRRIGLSDEKDYLGKTESELGWHIDSAAAELEEKKVLEMGVRSTSANELVLTGGRLDGIEITRVPWYHEKEIVGMMGMISGDRAEDRKKEVRLGFVDRDTELLSFRGAIEAGLIYADQYRLKKIDYTGLLIDVAAYAEAMRESTEKAKVILTEISATLKKLMNPEWAIARIGLCCFLCFCRRDHAGDVEEKIDRVSGMLPTLWRKLGIQADPVLAHAIVYGSEVTSLDEMFMLLIRRISSTEKAAHGESPYVGDYIDLRREVFDSLTEHVIVSDPRTYELVYMNRSARRDFGIKPDGSLNGCRCYEVLEGQDVPCGDCPNLLLRKDCAYEASHLNRRRGAKVLIRSALTTWENRTLRLTVEFDINKYLHAIARDHELIYQEMRANEAISLGMAEEDPGTGIEKTIACISENMRSERFLIFEERDDNTVSATYEWTAPGVFSLKEELQSIPLSELRALYTQFASQHVVMVSDMDAFQKENPGFSMRIHDVRSFISGQLKILNQTEGFTMVINPAADTFRNTSVLLSTLTDFIAIMIRNRNSVHQLEKQSMIDQMTGAGNRRALERQIREWKGDGLLGVISVDLNGLKNTNDTAGHHAGDVLICETARVLQECAGEKYVFRTGGDEFIVLTEDLEERDISLLIRHMRENAENNGISMAIGFAACRGKVTDFDALLTRADFNMYKDKGHSFRRRRDD